jgi:hypothetical protein
MLAIRGSGGGAPSGVHGGRAPVCVATDTISGRFHVVSDHLPKKTESAQLGAKSMI